MARYLIDTHVFLWMNAHVDRLGAATRELLEDPQSDLVLSAASSWEIAIKHSIGRLALPEPPAVFVPKRIASLALAGLPIGHDHCLAAGQLPPHHRDPFDRVLIAQAQIEAMRLVTVDPVMRRYEVEIVDARA